MNIPNSHKTSIFQNNCLLDSFTIQLLLMIISKYRTIKIKEKVDKITSLNVLNGVAYYPNPLLFLSSEKTGAYSLKLTSNTKNNSYEQL